MKSYKYEKFFNSRNIAFRKDEGYPEEFSRLGVTGVYYLPSANLVIDIYDVLIPETSQQLELSGYPVFLVRAEKELMYILEHYGISN